MNNSNLCVSGETLILTEQGYFPIQSLSGTKVKVWNGSSWSLSTVQQTGVNQTLYRVEMSDGSFVNCTAYHKFYVKKEGEHFVERRTIQLKAGDISEQSPIFPIISTNACINDPEYQLEKLRDNVVPFEFRIFSRLTWLARRLDEGAGYMQITSDDIDWLRLIKLFSNTLGTAPFIGHSPRGYHLRFCSEDVDLLLNELLMPIKKKTSDYHHIDQPAITVVSITKLDGEHNTYCFNETVHHRGIFNGIYTGNCDE